MMYKIDYLNPDYTAVFKHRAEVLSKIRANSEQIPALKTYYRDNPHSFVSDWGLTYDPRNLEKGFLSIIPMVCWPRQVDYIKWVHSRWREGKRGLCEKSRDCGVSWLSVGFAVSMWLFHEGFAVGFGSRKEELVDRKGDPKSIFDKIRFFLEYLPVEFLPVGWNERLHSSHMKVVNPENRSTITGEAGDNMGRGGRTSVYFVDEAAFVEHQDFVDAALSQTTNCQIDISTPNGPGNSFARKRIKFNNSDRLFIFDWRDDPRKTQEWYDDLPDEYDEITIAQEVDRDYNASAEDAFIPAKWVNAAIDAHIRLGIEPIGSRVVGFDPADVGDERAAIVRKGPIITEAVSRSSGDITDAIPWVFEIAEDNRADAIAYDADGMGAPVMKVALTQRALNRMKVIAYHGSAGVMNPGQEYGKERQTVSKKVKPGDKRDEILHSGLALKTNEDQFLNFRSQTWTWARDRFEATYHAVQRAIEGKLVNIDPDKLISISSKCEKVNELKAELSSPKRLWTATGKVKVESKADMKKRGVLSPNLADGAIISLAINPATQKKTKKHRYNTRTIQDRSIGY